MDCVCFNISISVYNFFLLLTEYMEKSFSYSMCDVYVKEIFAFFAFWLQYKVHFGIKMKSVEINSVYFSIFSIGVFFRF